MKRAPQTLALLLPLLLVACGDDTPPPQTYTPLQYRYLNKIRLNVGTIDVQDHSVQFGQQDIAATSPTVPAQALAQLARDRLFAAGVNGTATFTIDQASILRGPGGALDGQMAVHLEISDYRGRGGYVEARIARQHVPGSGAENEANNLYNLTKQMLDDMNVELEFQVHRNLARWLVSDTAAPAPVLSQPLQVPPPQVPGPPPPALPAQTMPPQDVPPPLTAQPAPPSADGYQDPALPAPPQQMSPPPGYLQPPPASLPPASGY